MENQMIQIMAYHWFKIFIFMMFVSQAYGQYMNITFIEDAVAKGAVCLDGSPGAYFYDKGSGEGINNWMIYLPGGGWCSSKDNCLVRSGGNLGSTKNVTPQFFNAIRSSNQDSNPDFYNWNRVYIQYCDGASFMADVEAVDPKTNLHLRGARIFRSTMEELLAKGMTNATNAIFVGNSAGGLAVILNCDRFRAFLPNAGSVKCIADSGFFIHARDLPGVEGREGLYAEVTVFHELPKSLPTSCTSRMNPSLCLFPENVVGDIQTPVFLLNSAFDKYQIQFNLKPHPGDELGWYDCTSNIKNCTESHLQLIKDFRITFLETLKEVRDIPSRGMFINSCYIHDFLYRKWNWLRTPIIENKTISKAIGDWFFNRTYIRLIDTKNDSPLNCMAN